MVWNPAIDRIGTPPARGRRRTGNLLAFLLVGMFLLANVLADTIAILPSPLLGRWLFLALEIAAALALITVVHTTRVGGQARWSRSNARATRAGRSEEDWWRGSTVVSLGTHHRDGHSELDTRILRADAGFASSPAQQRR